MRLIALITLLLAGCAPLPPSPEDIEGRKFGTLPDKSVIYIVRGMDSNENSGLLLDDHGPITTFRNTYYRWEVAPGTHRVAGFGRASESVTLSTEPGRIYFLEHNVQGSPRLGATSTRLRQIGDQEGRALVSRAQLLK